jgi:uncharacterized repeat protein (TIGR03803 family)
MKSARDISVRWAAAAALFAGNCLMFPGSAFAYSEKTLYTLCPNIGKCADGSLPHDLAMDADGNLYGTTFFDGAHDGGTVFQFSPSTGTYNVLYNFCSETGCTDGQHAYRVKPVIDTAGNLYGTARDGGDIVAHGGVVFELIRKKSGWRYKVLYTFCSKRDCKDGALPDAGLTYAGASTGAPYDGVSPLYGTGAYSVFQVMPRELGSSKWEEAVLHTFCQEANCTDGEMPSAPLYVDDSGNLYGTTELGGQSNWGTVYQLSPVGDGSYTYSVLYSFCAQENCADGKHPRAGVIMDTTGNLVGTAAESGGGASVGPGTLFKLAPQAGGTWQYSVLASFGGSKGKYPRDVIFGADGSLFGTTYGGGSGKKGTVFKFDGAIQTLYTFCSEADCTDGARPGSGVIQDANGNLFGTTEKGGTGHGVLYQLSPDRRDVCW